MTADIRKDMRRRCGPKVKVTLLTLGIWMLISFIMDSIKSGGMHDDDGGYNHDGMGNSILNPEKRSDHNGANVDPFRLRLNVTLDMVLDKHQTINRAFLRSVQQVRHTIIQSGDTSIFGESALSEVNELEVDMLEYGSKNLSDDLNSKTTKCKSYLNEVHKIKTVAPYVVRPSYGVGYHETLCLVTTITENRLYQLERLLKAWKGCLTLVVYLEKDKGPAVVEYLKLWIPKYHEGVSIHFAYKDSSPLIPINFLRNLALVMTNAEYVMYTDVDLIPSAGLHDKAMQYINQDASILDNDTAIIFPAFQLKNKKTELPVDKSGMLNLLSNGAAVPFYEKEYKPAYGPTDYNKWKGASSGYYIHPDCYDEFEPYILIRHRYMLYPEIFVHRFINKVIYYTELCLRRFKILVDPSEFLTHVPHSKDSSANIILGHYNVKKCAYSSYKLHYDRYHKHFAYSSKAWTVRVLMVDPKHP